MSRAPVKQIAKRIEIIREQANVILHKEIESEMWHLMQTHHNLSCALKGMGGVTLYDVNGDSYTDPRMPKEFSRNPAPKWSLRLYELADLDTEFYSLTGYPLKIYRDAAGFVNFKRDW